MRHYNIEIELTSGELITGKALTTRIKNKQEFIVIERETKSEEEIRLDMVKSLQPLDGNAEFGKVEIS